MRTVLLAEDNAANRELLRDLLEARGYAVVEAVDGGEALERLQGALPDLVLLDVRLPKLDGYQVLQAIRRDERLRDLTVVAVTAFAMAGSREKALEAGFDAYVTKPIDMRAMMALLERYAPLKRTGA